MSLHDSLTNWQDWDGAAYHLAKRLGLIDSTEDVGGRKGMLWSDNPVGSALHQCLNALVDAGILERRDESNIQFRWNPKFSLEKTISQRSPLELKVGDLVELVSTGEVGRIVSIWDDDGMQDCYVAFFGDALPNGKPSDKPYILHYYAASLRRISSTAG